MKIPIGILKWTIKRALKKILSLTAHAEEQIQLAEEELREIRQSMTGLQRS